MRLSLRLAELLRINNRPHGYINQVAERTGLERHVVSALMRNKYRYLPLRPLARLCDYLIAFEGVDPHILPGALFSRGSENFWDLLAYRESIELCLGMRLVERGFWVRDCDSSLQGQLLHGIFSHQPVDSSEQPEETETPSRNGRHLRRRGPKNVDPMLVLAPDDKHAHQAQQQGRRRYQDFRARIGDCALVCLGSMKVNPVVEMVFANTFGCTPFVSGADVPLSSDRCCPFMFRYRRDDPKPLSCAGGVRLSRKEAPKQPGIYFEQGDGSWDCVPCELGKQKGVDAALVFYVNRVHEGRLEMVLGGFSGLASQFLAKRLNENADEFWPPCYRNETLEIGAFIVRFEYNAGKLSAKNRLAVRELEPKVDVIRLDEEVIQRRVEKKRARA